MDNNKQTVVDWLSKELMNVEPNTYGWDKVIEQAKEMHKHEIIESYREGRTAQKSKKPSKFYNRTSEQYYNEAFGGNENE